MAVENLDQLVDLIITRTPTSGEDIRTFVKGEIRDMLAHMPAKYCSAISQKVTLGYSIKNPDLYDHCVDFINFIIRDSRTESHKGEKK